MRAIALALVGFVTLAMLGACSPPATQVLVSGPEPTLRVRPLVSSLEVRDVSLPRYAAGDGVVVGIGTGELQELTNVLWADDPQRALTLMLARDLGIITGARVATETWPFAGLPAAQLTVRIDELLAQPGGALRMTGQYAVAPVDSGLSDRSGRFNIVVPVPGETGTAVAAAHGAAIAQLSETIARSIAR